MAPHGTTAVLISVSTAAIIFAWHWRRRRKLQKEPAESQPQPPTEELIKKVTPEPAPSVHLSRTPSRVSLTPGQSRFGLDIGGSLLKLIYLEDDDNPNDTVVNSLKVLDQISSRAGSKRASRQWTAESAAAVAAAAAAYEDEEISDQPPVAILDAAVKRLHAQQRPSPPKAATTRGVLDPSLTVHVPALGGKLYFAHFQTHDVEHAVEVLRQHRLTDGLDSIQATGGGAHKFRKTFESRLNIDLLPCNELDAVVLGMCLMVKAVADECYTFERVADPSAAESSTDEPQPVTISSEQLGIHQTLRKIHKPFSNATPDDFFPFLLCNVGTGVSILHVSSETNFTRVSGTALGGGTFLGLTRLLTAARHFQDALDSAQYGDARNVDMLVKDIYGAEDRTGLQLPGDLTASFFAKNLMRKNGERPRNEETRDEDICKSLVVMIAQNLAQIAHLNARIHGARRVFFTGNFLRNNDLALRTIVYTMQRWSQLDKVTTEAVFFRHEGYFGAVGAFLQTMDPKFVRELDFEGASSGLASEASSRTASVAASPHASRHATRKSSEKVRVDL